MIRVTTIKRGIVIDHIRAGRGLKIFHALGLNKRDLPVALLMNVNSDRMGMKDIIKIENETDFDFTVLGFIDPGVTINVIEDENIVHKEHLYLPDWVEHAMTCKNPRCITTIEQEVTQRFYLADRIKGEYRCEYCDDAYKHG